MSFFHQNSNLKDTPTMIDKTVVDVCRIGATYYASVIFGHSLPGFARDSSNQSMQRIESHFLIRVSDGGLTIPKWQEMWKIENSIKYEHSYVYRVEETLAIFTVIQKFLEVLQWQHI